MIFEVIKNLHNDFSVFEKNKLTPRAYQLPYQNKDALKAVSYAKERYSSDMVTCLSGEWGFRFYKSVSKLPNRFDTGKTRFDTVTVPCDWQRTGYQEPVYINCPYETDTIAPDLPEDMPVGVYRKFFTANADNKRYILSFLGVANNLSLYVNGSFVGYSEGTHNTAEFDITDFVTPGTNELAVVSFKWCNGSFLEAQDMFRENGIFRDVLLYAYNKTGLYDFEVVSQKKENGYSVQINTQIFGDCQNAELCAELIRRDGTVIAAKQVKAENELTLDLGVLQVTEWNAEVPVTYDLFLTLINGDQTMSIRNVTGFKTIEIRDSVFYINGKPIKIKGVNHHDTNLYKGYAMSLEDMETDVRLMKELNVNGVRTSHYPPDPYFVILADLNGLYIIDEADIETHGCAHMINDIDFISRDIKWANRYVDRVKRMYYRDRNRVSVTMWSLGNESGGIKCHDKCYRYLKSTGTKIPVHYEGAINTPRMHYDVVSRMYASTEEMERMTKGKVIWEHNGKKSRDYNKFPFFLCEYCHAMGVGPGNLEEYWDIIYDWDTSMGGCIWEWADHAVYHDDNDKKYKYRYTYGGDHGEKRHDGHFCVDGLMYADRRLHTGAKEMKVVYRPIRASVAGNKLYCFENTNRFRSSDYINIHWDLLINGQSTQQGDICLQLAPMAAECVHINHADFDEEKDCHLNLTYTDKQTGHVIAVEQLTLNDVPYEYDIEIGSKIAAEVENGILTVHFANGECIFNGKTGALTSYVINGKELLNAKTVENVGITANLYRALIDNDADTRDIWHEGGLDNLKQVLTSFDVHMDDGEIDINAVFDLKHRNTVLYGFTVDYIISAMGAMEIKTALTVKNEKAVLDIGRFGITLELARAFETARYYGRGTAENMPDFKCQSPVGIYEQSIDDMYEPYVYPQESGMHCDTKWVRLTGKNGEAFTVYADSSLAFSVHHFTQNAVNKAQHQEDISDMGLTFLTLDGFVRGIGSSSCGPDTRAEYKGDASKGYTLSFTVIPE